MKRSLLDSLPSAVYDGEASEVEFEAPRGMLEDFGRLSTSLRVPERIGTPDPGFLVRFRERRDALRESLAGQSWRWLTLRLAPVAVGAVLIAGFVIFQPAEQTTTPAFVDLELMEWGHGVDDVTAITPTSEPVLRIALGEL